MQRAFGWIAGLVSLMLVGCAVGPGKLVSSHEGYNDAVQLTVTREVLMNIVRARYMDPLQFIAVSTINAQFSVSVSGTAGASGLGQPGAIGQATGTVGYSDSPTITYVPQSDAAFYKSLYSPVQAIEAVSGASLLFPNLRDEYIKIYFAAINGASDIGPDSGALYNRRVNAISRLFELGASLEQLPEWDFDSLAIPKTLVTAKDKVKAFQDGLYFIEEGDGENVRLARFRLVPMMVLSAPDQPGVIDALKALGVEPGKAKYPFRPPTHASPGHLDPYTIWVTPRSVRDMIYLAARHVDIPAAHDKIVPPLDQLRVSSGFALPVRIRSSAQMPANPYRVQHRGHWFYIDDSDFASKGFLEVVVTAYSSRVGSKQAGDETPQLVLPIGTH